MNFLNPDIVKNTIVCNPRYYKNFKFLTELNSIDLSFKDYRVIADAFCTPSKAYLFDKDGEMHEITLEEEI
jgi:hypothetical protein